MPYSNMLSIKYGTSSIFIIKKVVYTAKVTLVTPKFLSK